MWWVCDGVFDKHRINPTFTGHFKGLTGHFPFILFRLGELMTGCCEVCDGHQLMLVNYDVVVKYSDIYGI